MAGWGRSSRRGEREDIEEEIHERRTMTHPALQLCRVLLVCLLSMQASIAAETPTSVSTTSAREPVSRYSAHAVAQELHHVQSYELRPQLARTYRCDVHECEFFPGVREKIRAIERAIVV